MPDITRRQALSGFAATATPLPSPPGAQAAAMPFDLSGLGLVELFELHGRIWARICDLLRPKGSRPRKVWHDGMYKELKWLWMAGYTYSQIARELDLSYQTVINKVHSTGLYRRTQLGFLRRAPPPRRYRPRSQKK